MIRRTAHYLLRLVAGIIAGLIVLGGLLLWRLERGPIAVDFLAPYVARALGSEDVGIAIAVDRAALSLGERATLEMVAQGVHLSQRDTGSTLTLPEMAIDLSLRAMLRGIIAPARIVLTEPYLRVVRDPEGSFHLGFGSEEAGISEDWAARFGHDLAGPPDPSQPLGALTDVAVRRARLIVDDRSLGIVWRADDVDILVHRSSEGVRGEIRLAAAVGEKVTQVDCVVIYRPAQAQLDAKLDFAGLRPADWAAAAPVLAPLATLDLPLSGTLQTTLDPTRIAITGGSANIVLGPGMLRHEALAGGELVVSGGGVAGSFDPAQGRIKLERLALSLNGPQVAVSGTIDGVGNELLAGVLTHALDASLDLDVQNLPANDFPRLWPEQVSPHTRAWVVDHIHDGTVDQLKVQLTGQFDLAAGAARQFHMEQINGTLAYRNLAIDYFKPLPPVRAVDGTAIFDRATLVFTPSSGTLMGVHVTGGSVKLYQLDTNDEQIAIALALNGPLKDALTVIDSDPLHYARSLSIDPRTVAGDFAAHLAFGFPLVDRLSLRQVDFNVQATLDGVAAGKAIFERDLSNGHFDMQLGRTAMRLDGTAALAGVPVALTWTQSLNASDAIRTRYTVRGRVDDTGRENLGLDFFADMLKGPVDVDLDFTVGASRQAQATLKLGLGDAALDIAKLDWSKSPGIPATAQLKLDFADDRLTAIRDAVITGEGVEAQLAAGFSPSGDKDSLTSLEMRRLVLGKTNVTGSLAQRPEGGCRLQVTGPSFDAAGLIEELQKAPPSTGPEPPLFIDAKLGRLLLGAGREATDVAAVLVSDGSHWQAATLDATQPGGGKLQMRFGTAAGNRKFNLTTDDFGGFLRLLDLSDNVRGGQFRLDGDAVDEGARRVLKGHADGADYRVVGAPILARLLSLASLSGISALLNGEGIPFSRLTADVVYGDGRLAADNLRAYGGAIGVNASGTVDEQAGTIDVSGTLVPAYLLNTILGNIPLLGNWLMGGAGQGIFGANFRVAGPLNDPKLSVNPLSALAPGVLRKLFLFEPGNPAPAAPAPPAEGAAKP